MSKKAKTWQKPKADHPWRQYKNRVKKIENVDIEIEVEIVGVKEYLVQIINNWEDVTATFQSPFEGSSRHKLKNLPEYKKAAWLAGALKRNFVQKRKLKRN